MKRATLALALTAVGLWSAGVLAQGRNFAGAWTIDQEKTMAATMAMIEASGGTVVARSGGGGGGAAGGRGAFGSAGGGGGTAAVARSGGGGAGGARGGGGGGGMRSGGPAGPTTIALDTNTFTIGVGENHTMYRLDGAPSTTDTPAGRATSKASWKDDKLVIETTTDTANGPVASTVLWYLEGESLVRETQTTNASGQPNVRKTYFKRA